VATFCETLFEQHKVALWDWQVARLLKDSIPQSLNVEDLLFL
jgi:hypothetical protein